jgi:3-hydroxybutyryl-CoA dehydratase
MNAAHFASRRLRPRAGWAAAAVSRRGNRLDATAATGAIDPGRAEGRRPVGLAMTLALQILHFEDLAVGMTERLSKTVASSDVVGFAQVTGDRNPIHLSEHFAAKTQFKKRIAHGLYTASLISAVLGTRLPGPGAVYISQTLNFRAPVKIGDTVDVIVEVAELIPERLRARLACTCKVGDEIVLDGEAWVKVPSSAAGGRPLPKI